MNQILDRHERPAPAPTYRAPMISATIERLRELPRLHRWVVGVALTVALGVAAPLAGYVGITVAYERFGPDPGVQACETLAAGMGMPGADWDETTISAAEYREWREQFADSRDALIRQHGAAYIDLAWQMSRPQAGGTAVLVEPATAAYSGLSGACAARGYILPPLMTY